MFPLKLEKLHSYGALKVLPNQLLIRTPYLKYVEKLKDIIQRLKALLYKDEDAINDVSSKIKDVRLVSKIYIFLPFKERLFVYMMGCLLGEPQEFIRPVHRMN